MALIPVSFPSEKDRLRRLAENERLLSFYERVQMIDGMLAAIDAFEVPEEVRRHRERLNAEREAEGKRLLREFFQQYTAAQSSVC